MFDDFFFYAIFFLLRKERRATEPFYLIKLIYRMFISKNLFHFFFLQNMTTQRMKMIKIKNRNLLLDFVMYRNMEWKIS